VYGHRLQISQRGLGWKNFLRTGCRSPVVKPASATQKLIDLAKKKEVKEYMEIKIN
jgi:L-lysine 2,3-aminomutase